MQENQTCTFARKVGYLIKSETLIQNPKNNPHDQEWTFYLLVGNNNTLLTNSVFICVLQSQQFQQIIVTFTIHGLTLRAKLTVKYHTLSLTLDRVSKASLRQRNLNIVYNFTTVFELLADRNLKPHLLTLGGLFHLIIKRKVEPVERWINCCLDLTLQRTWLS